MKLFFRRSPIRERERAKPARRYARFFIVFLFFLLSSSLSNTTQNVAAADDWLSGWDYRKPVNIESAADSLSDYQVTLTLQGNDPTAVDYLDFSKINSNGTDIRFTDTDKTTLIPYYIESWDNIAKTATVWLKMPSITKTSAPNYFYFSVPADEHNTYGLAYPITYEFDIPASSSNLKSYKKYSSTATWTQITEKTSADFFNGIEAVRFDYASNKAYVSVAFGADTEELYIKIDNTNGTQVATYNTISKYYDNRTATVTSSWDDWNDTLNAKFKTAGDMYVSKHLSYTTAIITGSVSAGTWADIQTYIDAGYLEPASHTRTHAAIPYADYTSEISGSRDDIKNNLDLSALSKKGLSEYVYTFIEPYGTSDASARTAVGVAKYLVDRSTAASNIDFSFWDFVNDAYNTVAYTIRMGTDGTTDTATLNASFDSAYSNGGIYHLMLHPNNTTFTAGQYADLHTSYISDKTDVWYAGLGYLYLYLFTKDRAQERHPISGKQLYVYYGKSGSSTTSSFDNTFTKDYSSDSNLAAQWHADEGTGITSADSSGNNNTCNLTSTTWSGTDGGQLGSNTIANFTTGSAFDLDGTNNIISCGNGASLNFSGNYSIEFWANSAETRTGTVVAKTTSTDLTGNGFFIRYTTANQWQFRHYYASTLAQAFQSVATGVWYHVVGVYDGSKIVLYVNGAPSTPVNVSSFNPAPTQNLKIGILSYTNAHRFKGSVDEVRVYSRALSSDEINDHYWRSKYSSLSPTIGVTQVSQEEPYVVAPTVTSQEASSVTTSGAILNGNVIDTSRENSTIRGFKYYLSSNCTGIANNKSESGSFGTGAYSVSLTGLLSSTAYSYKAYATNPGGTGTSTSCRAFTTSASASSDSGGSSSSSDSGGSDDVSSSSSSSSYLRYLSAADMALTETTFPTTAVAGAVITLDASDLLPNFDAVKYTWDFGDGTTDEGRIVNHTYSAPGRYTITITAYDIKGNKETVERTIDVNPAPPIVNNIKSTNDTDLLIEGNGYKGDIIYLTIHSTPLELQSSVDNTGYWSYTISKASEAIGEGDHTVSAVDSFKLADNTELKSSSSDDTKFKVSVENGKLKVEMEKSSRLRTIIYILSGIIILMGVGYALYRRKRKVSYR